MSILVFLAVFILCLCKQLYCFQSISRPLHRSLYNPILSPTTLKLSDQIADAETIYQVFVGNLPFAVDEEELTSSIKERIDYFKTVYIPKDRESGRSRGFGYVHFDDQSKAETAAEALTGLEIEGRILKVDVAQPREQRKRTPQENCAFIGNLDYEVTEDQVMEMCNDLLGEGVAQKVRLLINRETGLPRGYGHIDFSNPEDANRAIETLNGVEMVGRVIKVDHAQRRDPAKPRKQFGDANSVFIGNLAWDITHEMCLEMLNDVLGPEGGFTNVRLAADRDGRPKGFGHIDFKDKESAEKAIKELNGMEVLRRELRADFAIRRERPGR